MTVTRPGVLFAIAREVCAMNIDIGRCTTCLRSYRA